MDPMTISLIASAVLGYAKQKEQHDQFKDSMKIESGKERYGAFTGERGKNGQRPSSIDPMFQSLMTGAAMGQNLKKAGFGQDGKQPTTAQEPMSNVQSTGRQSSMAQSPYMSPADNAQSMEQRYPWSVPQDGGA